MTNRRHETNMEIEDEPAPLGAVYRVVMEIEVAGGTIEKIIDAVTLLGDDLVGRVIDPNNGDAIVIIGNVSRDVDYSPTYAADEPDLT